MSSAGSALPLPDRAKRARAERRTAHAVLRDGEAGETGRDVMSTKAAARKASKRARREQEVILGPAVAAGTSTGVRRGPPVAPSSGLLSGSVVNDEWQTVRRSWCDLHDAFPLRPHPCAPNYSGTCARTPTERCLTWAGRKWPRCSRATGASGCGCPSTTTVSARTTCTPSASRTWCTGRSATATAARTRGRPYGLSASCHAELRVSEG